MGRQDGLPGEGAWLQAVTQEINQRHQHRRSSEAEVLAHSAKLNIRVERLWTRLHAKVLRAVETYNSAVIAEENKCFIEYPPQSSQPRSLVIYRNAPGPQRLFVALNAWTQQVICNRKRFSFDADNGQVQLREGERVIHEEDWAESILSDFLSSPPLQDRGLETRPLSEVLRQTEKSVMYVVSGNGTAGDPAKNKPLRQQYK